MRQALMTVLQNTSTTYKMFQWLIICISYELWKWGLYQFCEIIRSRSCINCMNYSINAYLQKQNLRNGVGKSNIFYQRFCNDCKEEAHEPRKRFNTRMKNTMSPGKASTCRKKANWHQLSLQGYYRSSLMLHRLMELNGVNHCVNPG